MFNKHLALLQPEQERIQCYLGTACRTTQHEAAKLWYQLKTHGYAEKPGSLLARAQEAPGHNSVLCADLKCSNSLKKRSLLPVQADNTTVGARGRLLLQERKRGLHCFTSNIRHLLIFVLNSSSKHNEGLLLPSKCHYSIEMQD